MRRIVYESIVLAHMAASYAVMAALCLVGAVRGVSARELAGLGFAVLAAPLTAPLWLFLLTPIDLLDRTGRISVQPLPGARIPNLSAAAVGYVAYFAVFALVFRPTRRRAVRRHRRSRGLCEGCGYDVRASREAGRCPECGEALRPAARA